MSRRGYLLEIQGCPVGFFTQDSVEAAKAAAWAEDLKEAIRAPVPTSQAASVNPFDGSWGSSGGEVRLTTDGGIFAVRQQSPIAELTADLSPTGGEVFVFDTTGFPNSGRIWIGAECIEYVDTTPSTFGTPLNPVTRGVLGTFAASHSAVLGSANVPNQVYGYNPSILRRLARIVRYDLDDGLNNETVFRGSVDDFEFGQDGFVMRFLSFSTLFEDAVIQTKPFARATLRGAYFPSQSTLYQDLKAGERQASALSILVEDPNTPFPELGYFRAGDEIIQYFETLSPSISSESGTNKGNDPKYGLYFDTDGKFEVGDLIEYLAPDPLILRRQLAKVTRVIQVAIANTKNFLVWHTGRLNPGNGQFVSTPSRHLLGQIYRGRVGTREQDQSIGTELAEVRVYNENQAMAALQFMLSVDGNRINSSYDVLPTGWGAAIPEFFVNIESFEKLIPLTSVRDFVFEGSEQLAPMLRNLARITGARIFIDREGRLTASLDREIYPDSKVVSVISQNETAENQIPTWHPQSQNLYNSWVFRGNAPRGTDKNFSEQIFFEDPISVARYGRRSLADYEDRGIKIVRDGIRLELLALGTLQRWAYPNPILDLVVALPVAESLRPGALVTLYLPHLPNLAGGSGLVGDFFEVLEVTPQDATASARVRLAQMPPQRETRLVGPCAEVLSVLGSNVTIKSSADTGYAPPGGKDALGSILGIRSGNNDIDFFALGNAIRLIRRVSLGQGPFESFDTTISNIDYGSQLIEVANLPPWTLTANDLIFLDEYPEHAGVLDEYQKVFCFFSPLIGDEPKHVWGL